MTNTMSVFSFIPPLTMPCLAVGAHYSHVLWTRHNKCFIMQFLKMQPLLEQFKDAHEKFHREMHFSGLVPILRSKAPSMPLPAAGLVIYTPSRNFLAHPLWQSGLLFLPEQLLPQFHKLWTTRSQARRTTSGGRDCGYETRRQLARRSNCPQPAEDKTSRGHDGKQHR